MAASSQDAIQAEIRALAGEIVSTLRTVSEGVGTLTRTSMRSVVLEIEHALRNMARLIDQLP
jgi:hypothetical protein